MAVRTLSQVESKMKKVFIIHGFEGSPNGGWRPYLMHELEKHDVYACALSMPTPEAPVLSEWLEELKRHIDRNSKDDIYLVGHSLGGTTILRYLEQFESPNIKAILLASTPCHQNANGKIVDFLKTDFDWKVIEEKIKHVVVIHGDNDPYVPITDAEEITRQLNGKLIIIPNGKHLNGSAGYIELPEAVSALLEMIR
jgi:predicted alpha/beta hydrolase family esterase